jgi:hypothetical protein
LGFTAFLCGFQQGDLKNAIKTIDGTSVSKGFYKKNQGGKNLFERNPKSFLSGGKKNYGCFFRVPASSRSPMWALFAKMVPIEVPVANRVDS